MLDSYCYSCGMTICSDCRYDKRYEPPTFSGCPYFPYGKKPSSSCFFYKPLMWWTDITVTIDPAVPGGDVCVINGEKVTWVSVKECAIESIKSQPFF